MCDKAAAEYRKTVESVFTMFTMFTRYLAGDASVVQEIHDNAASSAPVNAFARRGLKHEPVRTQNTRAPPGGLMLPHSRCRIRAAAFTLPHSRCRIMRCL